MKSIDKISEGVSITFDFAAGGVSVLIGLLVTFFFLLVWGIFGLQAPFVAGYLLFGLTPLGIGIGLLKRGHTRKTAFKRKLLRNAIRKIAFQNRGKVRPLDLVTGLGYSSQEALQALREITAEDPENIDLQLDYDTGEIYFEFQDIIKSIEAGKPYEETFFNPRTWTETAAKVAKRIDELLNLFDAYRTYKHRLLAESSLNGKLEEYQFKVRQLREEIEQIRRSI
ncbi:MAG TPA: hypothetical protein VNM22_07245 [Candidatus Limnocylindrales bacterium]|nr:hypothetical protein [Candidatus Limnocylindrales bacterium]